ncbi:MAG: OPT family oligopeptide transporter [Janthinobacterium lividum]
MKGSFDSPHHPQTALAELTVRGVILGALITIVFTASNVYLGLKVGLTFSSAIPSAIISMAVLRAFAGSNILENNMVQTQASAAGTLSSVIFVIPGLLMIGHWHGFPYLETFGICAAGGLLGVLFTIPLRHAMVVEGNLPFPEGVAAAEILRVGERAAQATTACANGVRADNATGVADIAAGGVVAALFSFASSGLRVLADGASLWGTAGTAAVFRLPFGFSLALLGAGYLIGLAAGLATLLGVIIAWGIAVPVLTARAGIPAGQSAARFATSVWQHDVRFIGAGIIGIAAVWTLLTLLGPVARGMRTVLGATRARNSHSGPDGRLARTERDLPLRWILAVLVVVVAMLAITFASFLSGFPQTAAQRWTLVAYGVVFAVVFGFLISAACGYMAGLIGSSSSPISGIGIIGTIAVSGLLLLGGRQTGLLASPAGTELAVAFTLFTVSAVLSVAAIANDNLQDLKTGWLVGATPWRQQVALLIGVVVGAAVMPPILDLLYHAFGFAGALPRAGMDASQVLSAPQATLMASIATGIFTHALNWTMLEIGVAVGIVLIVVDLLLKRAAATKRGAATGGSAGRRDAGHAGEDKQSVGLPVLAVGIGVYLPPVVSMPLVVGAVLAWSIERTLRRRAARAGLPYTEYAELPQRRALLLASGLIVGESLLGVVMAAVIGFSGNDAPFAIAGASFEPIAEALSVVVFLGVCFLFRRRVLRSAA